MDIGTTETVFANALGGDDVITVGPGLAALTAVRVDAGAGNDTIASTASSTLTLDGSTELDTLNFNGEGQAVQSLGGSIVVGGTTRVSHQNVETVNVANAVGHAAGHHHHLADGGPDLHLGGVEHHAGGHGHRRHRHRVGDLGQQPRRQRLGVRHHELDGVRHPARRRRQHHRRHGDRSHAATRRPTRITVTVTQLTYLLAEGSTGAFFDLDLLIANPNAQAAPVVVTFLKEDGTTVTQNLDIAATSQLTLHVDQIAGLEEKRGVDRRDVDGRPAARRRAVDVLGQQLLRIARRHRRRRPAHQVALRRGVAGLLLDVRAARERERAAGDGDGVVPDGADGTVQRTFQVAPTSRVTVAAGLIPELVNRSFAIVVDSNVPIVAERAMYFGTARFWDGGHESAGVSEPSANWFLAEGATGAFFDTFVLVANPNPTPTDVAMTFLTDQGQSIVRNYTVAANARLTVNMEDREPAARQRRRVDDHLGHASRSSSSARCTGRATACSGARRTTASASPRRARSGASRKGASARTRRSRPTSCWPTRARRPAAQVRVTYLRTAGAPIVRTYTVNPTSRFNIDVNSRVPELANESFGALDRGHQRRRDRRRAVALQRRPRPGVGGGHQRPRHAPAVTR